MTYTPDHLTEALELHQDLLSVDTHCDTPGMLGIRGWKPGDRHAGGTFLGGDLDLVRMKEGGLAAAFLAIYVGQGECTDTGYAKAGAKADALLDAMDEVFRLHPEQCERALSPADARRIHGTGRRAIFLGMENGYPLGRDLERLEAYHRRGIRYLTLCHARDNDLCASSTTVNGASMISRGAADTGLSEFGARVVERMNRLGMMVDISHVSERTVEDVLAVSKAPVIASHSGARAVGDHPRNLSDSQLRAIAAKGGTVQVLFVPGFLRPEAYDPEGDRVAEELWTRRGAYYAIHAIGEDPAADARFEAEYQALLAAYPPPRVSVADAADHIDHIVRVAGIDHVGIGSDFDGGARLTDCLDASRLPHLTAELLARGYTAGQLRKIWGGNLLRVFEETIHLAG